MTSYLEFLESKKKRDPMTGLPSVGVMRDVMKPHQSDICRWALKRGRAAVFAGTGLGKTLIELEWASHVARYTNKPVLIFAPLAVSAQHIREAAKFGIEARLARYQGEISGADIYVTNYQKMEHFDLTEFGGVVLDESSILKNVDGHYRSKLIQDCATVSFRLAATATPAPNDFMELGNHAEFLGVMSYTDMLATFFTHDGSETQKWRLKGHAENEFWKWMASWSVMLRKPSDLGYPDDGYDLPPLRQIQHVARVPYAPSLDTGLLFPMEAQGLGERIGARRSSVDDRVNVAYWVVIQDWKTKECLGSQNTPKTESVNTTSTASLEPWLIWCNLNSEQDALAKLFGGLCFSVRGSDSDEAKEKAITGWLNGERPVMLSKMSIMGFGLNLQFCSHTCFIGASDSFESVYQSIRRFWRFGQTQPVNAHFVTAETEGAVVANFRRKEADAERMAAAMVLHMADLSAESVRGMERDTPNYNPQQSLMFPNWMTEVA